VEFDVGGFGPTVSKQGGYDLGVTTWGRVMSDLLGDLLAL